MEKGLNIGYRVDDSKEFLETRMKYHARNEVKGNDSESKSDSESDDEEGRRHEETFKTRFT